ncbi:MAG: hypothetical protein QM677_09405 [Microbacterium sp.]
MHDDIDGVWDEPDDGHQDTDAAEEPRESTCKWLGLRAARDEADVEVAADVHNENPRPMTRGFLMTVAYDATHHIVDAAGFKPNRWHRFERLDSTWQQARRATNDRPPRASKAEPGVVRTPSRRTRTALTDSELDSIRTARQNGESVVAITRRFGVHRMTVWTHTRDLIA